MSALRVKPTPAAELIVGDVVVVDSATGTSMYVSDVHPQAADPEFIHICGIGMDYKHEVVHCDYLVPREYGVGIVILAAG